MLEIEIEGEHGWAKKLPTTSSGILHFTTYHINMNVIIFLVVIYSTLLVSKNLGTTIFFVIAWFLIEDFIWFCLNPYYTLKKYDKEHVLWHKDWFMCSPLHNWYGISVMLFIVLLHKNLDLLKAFIMMSILTLITISTSGYYHRWYSKRIKQNE